MIIYDVQYRISNEINNYSDLIFAQHDQIILNKPYIIDSSCILDSFEKFVFKRIRIRNAKKSHLSADYTVTYGQTDISRIGLVSLYGSLAFPHPL